MIGENIFNINTRYKNRTEIENKEYWANKKKIYEIFYKIIINEKMDPNILKNHIQYDFFYKLTNLFQSVLEDERENLKYIIHRLYSILVCRRKMIREIIFNYFYSWIIILNKTNGVEELLEVMASIISGFLIPLREDHINFFKKILIPLHKNKCEQYFDKLNTCTILYLGKEPNLSYILLENLFKIFYTQTYQVKILFLEEIEIILDYIDIVKISNYIKDLINIIVGCFSEYNIDLKKKALPFLKNNIFISIIKAYKTISFNIIFPKLNHLILWDDESESVINSFKQVLKDIDSIKYYDALNSKLDKEINLFPKNEEEENRQIMIALELSQKENKIKKIYKKVFLKEKAVIINKNKRNFKEKINLRKRLSDNIRESKNYEIKEEEFDEDFGICPITQEYMNNPVLCPSGNYYEKSAILDWLKKNDTEPLTRQYLRADMLIEDKEYKKKILEYRKKFHK